MCFVCITLWTPQSTKHFSKLATLEILLDVCPLIQSVEMQSETHMWKQISCRSVKRPPTDLVHAGCAPPVGSCLCSCLFWKNAVTCLYELCCPGYQTCPPADPINQHRSPPLKSGDSLHHLSRSRTSPAPHHAELWSSLTDHTQGPTFIAQLPDLPSADPPPSSLHGHRDRTFNLIVFPPCLLDTQICPYSPFPPSFLTNMPSSSPLTHSSSVETGGPSGGRG